jgi:hypothetical protein
MRVRGGADARGALTGVRGSSQPARLPLPFCCCFVIINDELGRQLQLGLVLTAEQLVHRSAGADASACPGAPSAVAPGPAGR